MRGRVAAGLAGFAGGFGGGDLDGDGGFHVGLSRGTDGVGLGG